MSTMEIRVGDQVPWLVYYVGIDLTRATGATFSLREKDAVNPFIDDKPALIADGTYTVNGEQVAYTKADGVLLYPWDLSDTSVERVSCEGLFKITWPEGQETWPSKGFIRVSIGENF